jgi:ABC-type amino acid transport substrate-binding protein
VDVVVVRKRRDLKGRVIARVLGTIGRRSLAKELGKTVKAIEARSYDATAAELT